MFDVEKVRRDFPILGVRVYDKPLVYLDSGATAQKPECVIETVDRLHRDLALRLNLAAPAQSWRRDAMLAWPNWMMTSPSLHIATWAARTWPTPTCSACSA